VEWNAFVSENGGKLFTCHQQKHGYQDILEEIKWENVKNVEQLFHRLRRSGQWPDAHPKLEKELS
jgi:hypothetical protein